MLTDNERFPGMDNTRSRLSGFLHIVKQASVRELGVLAVRLRDAGDEKGAEYLERQAVAILDKKKWGQRTISSNIRTCQTTPN